jgi:lysine 2,3-aminomutase
MAQSVAMHTHFNHPNEISWVTAKAAQKLHQAGVTVRNQSVLLRGVNDNVKTMKALIRGLADINVLPVRDPTVTERSNKTGQCPLLTPLSTVLCLSRGHG